MPFTFFLVILVHLTPKNLSGLVVSLSVFSSTLLPSTVDSQKNHEGKMRHPDHPFIFFVLASFKYLIYEMFSDLL